MAQYVTKSVRRQLKRYVSFARWTEDGRPVFRVHEDSLAEAERMGLTVEIIPSDEFPNDSLGG